MVERPEDLKFPISAIQQQGRPIRNAESEALWIGCMLVCLTTVLSFVLYSMTAAPGLTWAHHGADGGDLLAAAAVGGVPHPSGYPLYTLLLRAWLWAGSRVAPAVTPAGLGNLLSALLGALSVGCTVLLVARVVNGGRARWWLAASAAAAWAASPLLWSQSQITEVYTLHVLLSILIAMAIMFAPTRLWLVGILIGLGIANHLTFFLLLPAAGYYLYRVNGPGIRVRHVATAVAFAAAIAAVFYLRIPFAATGDGVPPPVNWGYADNWDGFWWLVSGEAYRGAYLGQNMWDGIVLRSVAWAQTVVWQFTPVGLVMSAVGLALWNRSRPTLRTFTLLWTIPLSVYAVVYATQDSEVYLLPVTWLMAVLAGAGIAVIAEWISTHTGVAYERILISAVVLTLGGVLIVAVVRAPHYDLRHDNEASAFLETVFLTVEADSVVVSSRDNYTFALWYAAWASGELFEYAPRAVVVNDALYQFEWYRRLLGDVYPHVPGVGESFAELLAQNAGVRPIFFLEHLDSLPESKQKPAGGIWRYDP